MTDDKIVYAYIGDNTGAQHEASSKEVYMVYIEKQGYMYMTPEGKRVTGETNRANAKKMMSYILSEERKSLLKTLR